MAPTEYEREDKALTDNLVKSFKQGQLENTLRTTKKAESYKTRASIEEIQRQREFKESNDYLGE